jgi:BirA family transcriptional regulator, biotin operon repressor / biotin---[acetyl-CoA-carboxylase] ligase
VQTLLLPLLRALSDGKFHSGAALALQFGVSRASICNALNAASDMGIVLHKVRGRGYRLPAPPDWLDAAQIRLALGADADKFSIEVVNSVDSTNAALLRAPQDAPHRHCLAAEIQLAGRGRRGRVWQSVLGGSLTCSIRWRFNQGMAALAGLSLAVGISVMRTLQQSGITDAQLKWPNDVLWQYRKLAGILIEVQGDVTGPSTAIIGIGINLQLPAEVRNGIDQAVADLTEISGAAIDRNALLAALLANLSEVMDEFEQHGLGNLRHEWQAAHAFANQPVRVVMANGSEISGNAVGLADNGALLLHTADDKQIAVSSGEVQLTRRI